MKIAFILEMQLPDGRLSQVNVYENGTAPGLVEMLLYGWAITNSQRDGMLRFKVFKR